MRFKYKRSNDHDNIDLKQNSMVPQRNKLSHYDYYICIMSFKSKYQLKSMDRKLHVHYNVKVSRCRPGNVTLTLNETTGFCHVIHSSFPINISARYH